MSDDRLGKNKEGLLHGTTGGSVTGIALEAVASGRRQTVYFILTSVAACHLLNDMMASLLPSMYPMFKSLLHLSFGQIGLMALTYQLTASLLQPVVGLYTDRHPKPFSLPLGLGSTLIGLLLLSVASTFHAVVFAAALVGVGSSVFHPESSRVARMASGGRYGLAQSLFQVGGNVGQAGGPLLVAFVVLSRGQPSIAWFSLIALLTIILLIPVSFWYRTHLTPGTKAGPVHSAESPVSPRKVWVSIGILVALIFSKYLYLSSINNYLIFYLINRFQVSVRDAQIHLFIFLASVAVGTFVGGPVGDRIGRKYVIWVSILGVLPFTLLLPHANLFWTTILTVVIGLVLASAFSAIIVYAQELLPGKVGMISGLFFGLAFGIAGLGAALFGRLADLTSIDFVYKVCAYLPAIGLLTAFLPNLREGGSQNRGRGRVSPS
ncbi:MAG: MFS transporter [Syntrophorhabdales bacterium]|jgi:FSR family fosmidomycin resistance protein-like MFS transporter